MNNRTMGKWIVIGIVVIHLLVYFFGAVSIAFPNVFKVFKDYGSPADYGLQSEAVILDSGEHAWWFSHPNSRRTVVICHGRSRGKAYMLPLIVALARDYNVFAIDFQGHGENPFRPTTLGEQESASVGAAVGYLEKEGHRDVVLFGVSMGGSAVLLWAGENHSPVITGVVADGTFARLNPYLIRKANSLWIPTYLAKASIALAGWMSGYNPKDVNPAESIAKIQYAGLILHGDEDDLIPVENLKWLRETAGKNFESHIYKGAHDQPNNPDFQQKVLSFVGRVPTQY